MGLSRRSLWSKAAVSHRAIWSVHRDGHVWPLHDLLASARLEGSPGRLQRQHRCVAGPFRIACSNTSLGVSKTILAEVHLFLVRRRKY